jgi:hypothetical protein
MGEDHGRARRPGRLVEQRFETARGAGQIMNWRH